jgi:hypothetical protein
MASYTITHLTRIDNYAVVQVLEDTEIEVGQEIVISSASDATFDGTHTVIDVEPYELIEVTDEGDLVYDYDDHHLQLDRRRRHHRMARRRISNRQRHRVHRDLCRRGKRLVLPASSIGRLLRQPVNRPRRLRQTWDRHVRRHAVP